MYQVEVVEVEHGLFVNVRGQEHDKVADRNPLLHREVDSIHVLDQADDLTRLRDHHRDVGVGPDARQGGVDRRVQVRLRPRERGDPGWVRVHVHRRSCSGACTYGNSCSCK